MRLNRRAALLGAGAAWAVAGRVSAQTLRTRRSASSLSATSDDVMAFGEGVRLMKRRNDGLSWAAQNRIHARDAQHGNDRFLPWHRLQLLHLEQIIAKLTDHATFAMPYWDWQEDRTLPSWIADRESPLFERNRARGVETLDFATARWAESKYVARLTEDDFPTFHGPADGGQGMVEAYGHNHIHALMGGLMSKPRTAASEPFFWLHHANVDRVWATWQSTRPASVYPEAWKAQTLTGFVGADGRPVSDWRVDQTLDPRALGYGYDRLYPFPTFSVPEVGPPGATRRIPTWGQVWRLRAEGEGGGRLSLELPDEIVALLRGADDTLMIEGRGEVVHVREPALEDRSVEIRLLSGSRTATLGSSPTFVHLPEPGEHDHGAHDGYRTPFRFGAEVLNLVDDGPLAVGVDTEDLTPDAARSGATVAAIELTLTLTGSRWA